MTFKNLIREIEIYLRIDNSETKNIIKTFINDSILDFVRLKTWEKLKVIEDITLDGSNSYDLSLILTNRFDGEIQLLNENGTEYQKYNYDTYLMKGQTAGTYAILGNILYVQGDNTTLKLLYLTIGAPYPLALDDDENLVTKFYYDIIKFMTIIKVLSWIGDETKVEAAQLSIKVNSLSSKENRIRKNGKIKLVRR